jgi:hypothetical protein
MVMNEKQAMQIVCGKSAVIGKLDGIRVIVSSDEIKNNLRCNDFELDLDFIQDFTCITESGDYEMLQGHSLSEIEVAI